MLRRVAVWVPVSLVLLVATADAGDLPQIKTRGTLKVIVAHDEQPEMYALAPGAANPGFEREMAEGFAKLHGLKLEVTLVQGAAERLPALQKGEGDFVIGIIETEERRKQADFTVEVLPARHLVVTYKPNKVVKTIPEFLQEKVGVAKGTSWAAAAFEAGVSPSAAQSFTGTDTLLDALRDGKISATVMSISDFTLATKRYPGLQGGVFVGPAGRAGWAVRKEDVQLKAALNDYLDNLRKGPSWSRLVVKYFGSQALEVLGRARQ